jgi:uncharacterized protein YndB with AHSA1/START domain
MKALPHRLERTLIICAARETAFRYFTDDARWARWWGAGSTIDPTPGGRVRIRYPDGTEAAGEVIEVSAPERIVFTFGYLTGKVIPPGGSRVTIHLQANEEGTRLHLLHEFADAAARDHHVQGWRYQLSLFGNVVSDEVNAGAAGRVDEWFAAWTVTDDSERAALLARSVSSDVRFRDRFSAVDGLSELAPHISAARHFMPGIRLERRGNVRHCQGTVLADWVAVGNDGQQRMSGTNVFALRLDGRIGSVVGFWN